MSTHEPQAAEQHTTTQQGYQQPTIVVQPVYAQPTYAPQPTFSPQPPQPKNGAALTSMIVGIVSIAVGIWCLVPILGFFAAALAAPTAIIAIIFGHIGQNRSKTSGIGRSQALAGLILGYIAAALVAATTAFWFVLIVVSGASGGMS